MGTSKKIIADISLPETENTAQPYKIHPLDSANQQFILETIMEKNLRKIDDVFALIDGLTFSSERTKQYVREGFTFLFEREQLDPVLLREREKHRKTVELIDTDAQGLYEETPIKKQPIRPLIQLVINEFCRADREIINALFGLGDTLEGEAFAMSNQEVMDAFKIGIEKIRELRAELAEKVSKIKDGNS